MEKKIARWRWKRSERGVTRRMAMRSIYRCVSGWILDGKKGGKDKKRGETCNPNRSRQQTQRNITQSRINSLDNQVRIQLHANPNTHNTKVHNQQRIQSPIQKHREQIPQRPCRRVIHALQVMVVHDGVSAFQRRRGSRHPAHDPGAFRR